jgi:hypothetical protein
MSIVDKELNTVMSTIPVFILWLNQKNFYVIKLNFLHFGTPLQ